MMPLDALLDANDHTAAELEGYGPVPADIARDIMATSKGRLWWRRLYARPWVDRWQAVIRCAAASTGSSKSRSFFGISGVAIRL